MEDTRHKLYYEYIDGCPAKMKNYKKLQSDGLRRAVEVGKESSNTQMQTSQPPCHMCDGWKRSFKNINFCGSCGRAIDR